MTTLSFEDNGFDPDAFRTKVEQDGPEQWRTTQADGSTRIFSGPQAEKVARDYAQQIFLSKINNLGR